MDSFKSGMKRKGLSSLMCSRWYSFEIGVIYCGVSPPRKYLVYFRQVHRVTFPQVVFRECHSESCFHRQRFRLTSLSDQIWDGRKPRMVSKIL